jgi:Casjensviridae DNA polymerase
MTYLYHDFETRSYLDINDCGLDRYITHPSTEDLMCSWAIDDSQPSLWQKHLDGQLCPEFKDALLDPHVVKVAWNSQFERGRWKYGFRTDVPADQFIDPMILARHLSMPGYLEDVCQILGLEEEAKLSWGTKKDPGEAQKLIKMFCMPAVAPKDTPLFGVMPAWYHDWDSDPDMWVRFGEYCKLDLISMRAAFKKMMSFPLPEIERRGWILDQKINDRGLPIDVPLARGSSKIAEQIKDGLKAHIKSLTALENPNSNPQMLAWLKTQGYTFGALGKAFVTRAMNGECELTPLAREVLEIRKQASKTSDSKLDAIISNVSDDGRLRNQFAYLGASRTGRWSAHGFQPQNLTTPSKEVKDRLELAADLLRNGDLFGLELEFPNVMDAVTGTIRSTVKASSGKKLAVADESAIENRVIGWVTGCESITNVFRDKKDPYLDFATRLYDESYEALWEEFKAGNKTKRTNSKPATLGCGFGLGGGDEFETKDGDVVKGGLWGYAWNMGVKLTKEEAHKSVQIFREAYPEVVSFWYDLEAVVLTALRNPGNPQTIGPITVQAFGDKLLRLLLPSGRGLHYIRPRIEKMEVHGRMKDGITCEGKDQKTHKWTRIKTYGGKLTENIVQAIARDVLLNGMLLADERGLPIVGHVHDEIICEVDKDLDALPILKECMMISPKWAPDLLLGAEGYEAEVYRKD